jgi:hypothetical protein
LRVARADIQRAPLVPILKQFRLIYRRSVDWSGAIDVADWHFSAVPDAPFGV